MIDGIISSLVIDLLDGKTSIMSLYLSKYWDQPTYPVSIGYLASKTPFVAATVVGGKIE